MEIVEVESEFWHTLAINAFFFTILTASWKKRSQAFDLIFF
jgi:hypothetical protein